MSEAVRQTVARRHPRQGLPHPALAELDFPALTVEGVGRMLALQFQFERSEWWPAGRLEEEQHAQLALVVAHACETTPYYQSLFAGVRLPAEPDRAFLRSLPISRRADIQAAGRGLVSRSHPKEHGPMTFARTSGVCESSHVSITVGVMAMIAFRSSFARCRRSPSSATNS